MNVVIAQSDLATAYGWGLDALWTGLLTGQTAIRATDRFAGRGFVSDQAAIIPGLEVDPGGSRVMAMLKRLLAPLIGNIDPMMPLIVATTVGEIEFVEWAILENRPDLAADARPQALLARVQQLLQLRGPAMLVSSACASSSAAVTQAASLIRRGDAKQVLVVTCDAVSEFVYSGFSTLLSLCAEPARPFDAARTGLTLGEAAAWAILSADPGFSPSPCTQGEGRGGGSSLPTPSPNSTPSLTLPSSSLSGEALSLRADGLSTGRGDKENSPPASSTSSRLTQILGWGNTTDAVHMTAPDRNAGGLSRAIKKACAMADRSPDDIAFIAAHGTATLYSDAMEILAFSGATRRPRPMFSIKGGIGHTLASAGLVQILIAGRAMSLGIVPPTVGLSTPDPSALGWVHNTPTRLDDSQFSLSTNSGFGGVNTAILLAQGNPA